MSISIHATLAGSDGDGRSDFDKLFSFQSTLPSRVATELIMAETGKPEISIHATLAGSDFEMGFCIPCFVHFNPRYPRG